MTPTDIAPLKIRNRIKGLRQVRAGDLRSHPKNWRVHPDEQRAALSSLLGKVGWASALIAREIKGGKLELIDGHLRADLDPDSKVPVLVLDVTKAEADLLLATLDPLSSMAGANTELFAELIDGIKANDDAVQGVLDQLISLIGTDLPADGEVIPPDDFTTIDENLETEHQCPKCGYQWSGGSGSAEK